MIYRLRICIITLLIFPACLYSQITRVNINRSFPVFQAENLLWLGTDNGIYNYNQGDDAYKFIPLPSRYNKSVVKQLHYYQEWLFCILDTGVAALQVRLNDWLFFDTTNGLPSNIINGIDFQSDNVWLATSNGIARFDLLIEQWEKIDSKRGLPHQVVRDVCVNGDKVWLLFDNSFSEYDPKYEKWRNFDIAGDSTLKLSRMFKLGDEIWFSGSRGLYRFNTQLQATQNFDYSYLNSNNLIELFLEGETIWAITKDGAYFYEEITGVWKEFEGNSNLRQYSLKNAFINSGQMWFLTDKNVLIWDRIAKSWEILDYASGLSSSTFNYAYSNGDLTLLFNPENLDYRTSPGQPWRKWNFYKSGGKDYVDNIFKNLFDNEEGGFIKLWDNNKWTFEGTRIRFLQDFEWNYDRFGNLQTKNQASNLRLDFKSQITLGDSRRINAFYNNVDYSETMYGIRYRGKDNDSVQGDLIREINWGDYRKDPGTIPFGEKAGIFGTNLWLQYGDKTPKYKRSNLTLKAGTGEIMTKKTYEYYKGARTQFQVTIKDINYQKNQYYSIPGLSQDAIPENLKVYIDDLSLGNNNPNTLTGLTIAGVAGDFDLLKSVEDYFYYSKAGVISFQKRVSSGSTIAISYTLNGINHEAILQYNQSTSTAQMNIYFLGAKQIIPYTFKISIIDSNGNNIPLSAFGLNESSGSNVDSRWIDYRNGNLIFPVNQPFPSVVYDSVPKQVYNIFVSYQTELPSIQLAKQNLLRNSEILRLDGVQATAGNDYILDYTNGSLIFVREGVLNPDTRIELEYEYYVYNEDMIYTATLNYSPSDNFYIQGDWQKVSADSSHLLTAHSEIRQSIGSYDLRVIPGIAFQTDVKSLTGASFDGQLSSSWLRFQSVYQNYSKSYLNLYRQQAVFGDVNEKLQFTATADIRDDLRLMGDWKNLTGSISENGKKPNDNSGSLGFLFHKESLPALQATLQQMKTTINDSTNEKYFIQSLLEYQVPANLLKSILLRGFKLESFLRYGQQTGQKPEMYSKERFFQNYYRINTQITDQIQGGFFYRVSDVRDISVKGMQLPESRNERLLIDIAQEQWRLLQMNFRVENNLQQQFQQGNNIRNYYLRQFSQMNFRLSPEQLWQKLSMFYFEFNASQSTNSNGTTRDNSGNYLWSLAPQNKLNSDDMSVMRNFFIKNEFRPSTQWFLYSLVEWNWQENSISASDINNLFWRWNEKLDIKLGLNTRLIAQYKQSLQNSGYGRVNSDYEPSLWLEHRWTPDLQNIVYALYRRKETGDMNIFNHGNNYEFTYDLIWRKNKFYGIRYLEVRQSLAGAYRTNEGFYPTKVYQFGSGTSLDIYPLYSLIIRTRFDINRNWDVYIRENDNLVLSFNIKISLQM